MGTDSLYYIMDYSGNYYRTNHADQLVAVDCEQDATVFTFGQANSRICVGKKAAFYCMVPVDDGAFTMQQKRNRHLKVSKDWKHENTNQESIMNYLRIVF